MIPNVQLNEMNELVKQASKNGGLLPGDGTTPPQRLERNKGHGLWVLTLRAFLENKLSLVGLAILALMILFCYGGPLIYHTVQGNCVSCINNINSAPNSYHILGFDFEGYDMLGRLMLGGQTSLEVGFAAAIVATLFGAVWGAFAGYFGGFTDTILMRIVDTLLAIPFLFALILLGSIITLNVWWMIVVIAIVSWLVPSRLVRGETLSLRTREYMQAVTMMGGSAVRAVFRHIIPNSIGVIMVNVTFTIADAILTVTALSYLGLGIPFPATNWGDQLSNGVQYMRDGYWWQFFPAGIAIVLTVVAFNFIGDALQDAFESRLQR